MSNYADAMRQVALHLVSHTILFTLIHKKIIKADYVDRIKNYRKQNDNPLSSGFRFAKSYVRKMSRFGQRTEDQSEKHFQIQWRQCIFSSTG